MEIAEPSPQMKTDLRKLVGTTMLNEWVEKAGPEGKAIVEAYQKM